MDEKRRFAPVMGLENEKNAKYSEICTKYIGRNGGCALTNGALFATMEEVFMKRTILPKGDLGFGLDCGIWCGHRL